jgi:hypothetical protein
MVVALDEAPVAESRWSGARDLNPGPHGPEICAVSSTETVFEGFEIDSRHRASH